MKQAVTRRTMSSSNSCSPVPSAKTVVSYHVWDATIHVHAAVVRSTSNVTAPFIGHFGFGAVTGNGYGLGYLTLPDTIPVAVSSFKSSALGTNSTGMAETITKSLREFDQLFK
jgi:hypothetical protein